MSSPVFVFWNLCPANISALKFVSTCCTRVCIFDVQLDRQGRSDPCSTRESRHRELHVRAQLGLLPRRLCLRRPRLQYHSHRYQEYPIKCCSGCGGVVSENRLWAQSLGFSFNLYSVALHCKCILCVLQIRLWTTLCIGRRDRTTSFIPRGNSRSSVPSSTSRQRVRST